MFFTDTVFFYYLLIVVSVYWCLPFRGQNLFLLVASYIFYGWVYPWTALLKVAITAFSYFPALGMERYPKHRKSMLLISVIGPLAILGYFKYAMFFLENLKLLYPELSLTLQVFLPAGISFFTFQAIAYSADVYLGKIKPEKSLREFALFIAFFPQLVAGPIERAETLLGQLRNPRKFSRDQFFRGLDLLALGYFKKLVVADNVALYVNMIFDLKQPSVFLTIVGAVGFGIQILADFSAYTDIARGCGRLLGIELMENFRHPYLATSPTEFWRRWHISLSNFIRDYIYIPLGGSRVSHGRWVVNIFIVWFICGLWHGAAWNFIVWGLYWGALIVAYRFIRILPSAKLFDPLRIAVMYVWISIGWLIFRVHEVHLLPKYFSAEALELNAKQLDMSLAVLLIFIFYALPLIFGLLIRVPLRRLLHHPDYQHATRIIGYTAIGLAIAVFAAASPEQFLYFQF